MSMNYSGTATVTSPGSLVGGYPVETVLAEAAADANTDFAAGAVVILVPKGQDSPNVYTARDTADSGVAEAGSIFGVAVAAVVDGAYGQFAIRGRVEVLTEGDTTAITVGMNLVPSLGVGSSSPDERALVPIADMTTGGSVHNLRKVVGIALEASSAAAGIITVDFNGPEGFGTAITLTGA